MVEEIVRFLADQMFWSPEEIALIRHDLPRWERYLRGRGITEIPPLRSRLTEAEYDTIQELRLLMMQAGHGVDPWIEHWQRDVTGVRPSKP